jgi:hypothetical protein
MHFGGENGSKGEMICVLLFYLWIYVTKVMYVENVMQMNIVGVSMG